MVAYSKLSSESAVGMGINFGSGISRVLLSIIWVFYFKELNGREGSNNWVIVLKWKEEKELIQWALVTETASYM